MYFSPKRERSSSIYKNISEERNSEKNLAPKRRPSNPQYNVNTHTAQARRRYYYKAIGLAATIPLIVVFLVFLGMYVIVPLMFKHSLPMQRDLIFERWNCSNQCAFTNFRRYGLGGVKNINVPINCTNTTTNIHLGTWHIVHLALLYDAVVNDDFCYEGSLRENKHPIVLYFHGSTGNRITYVNRYQVLRRFFNVFAFDYRGYGDSSDVDLSENGIVQDSIQLYKWINCRAKVPIYIWGYSLGASIATHTVAKLRKEGIVPAGLFLESTFTSMRDTIKYFPRLKLFTWLPWFELTVTKPLEKNGFIFNTAKYIKSVDCPIMIIHAEDDKVVPISLAAKLFHTAQKIRNKTTQGRVTFCQFSAICGHGHKGIYESDVLPNYIKNHIEYCESYNKGKG